MNPLDRNKLLKMLGIIAIIFMIVGTASYYHSKNSITLEEYAAQHGESIGAEGDSGEEPSSDADTAADDPDETDADSADETGEGIDSDGADEAASSAADDTQDPVSAFYYTPLSDELIDRITGVSYPAVETDAESEGSDQDYGALAISYDELRYVHILHYDFNGEVTEGELICNESIADDLLEIFYELYRNEYQIEKVRLIDEYDGDDTVSMEDNNTSCFNYRVVDGTDTLSKHALGLAIDINPLYNPYIMYNADGTQNVSPASGEAYADRSQRFAYKIDEDDLCYKLFTEHGFTWGGNWNSVKDYQHFQKAN